jgi:hypothetical protein
MKRDMQQRETLSRVDDEAKRSKVAAARRIIYEANYAVDSDAVEALLKEQSLVPTTVGANLISARGFNADANRQNAFSQKLSPLGFCLYLMLVVDLLHEFELGVWKNLFIHLLRMLNATDKALVHELDRR